MAQHQQEIAGGEEKYPRYRWVVLGLLMVTQEISVMLTGGIGILLPAMRADLGFGIAESGLLAMLVRLPATVLSIPASLLLVRFNPKRVYFASLVLAAVMVFFSGRSPAFIFLAVVYCLTGVSIVIRQIPDTLLRQQWIPKKEFASVMGMTMGLTSMGQSVAVMTFPFLLIVLGNWRNLFSVFSFAILFISIIWMVFARERITPAYREGISSRAGRAPLRGVLKRKEFLMMAIALFAEAIAYATTTFFLPTYLLEERKIALTTIGFIASLMPIGGVCSTFSMGFISDRIGLRKPTIWPAGLILPSLYFILFSPIPVWALPILTFLIGFTAWSFLPAFRAIPFELPGIKPSEIAVGLSLIQTISSLSMLGAPAVGYLAETFGSLGLALRTISLFPLALTIVGLLLPETGPKARSKKKEG